MPALTGPVQQALTTLRAELARRFGPRLLRMTLFGSYARGEAGPESDVDVLVVVEDLVPRERSEIYETGAEVWMDTGIRVAPLAFSQHQLADMERRELLLVEDIAKEGIPV